MAKANNIEFDLVFSGRWHYGGDKYKPRNPNYYVNRYNDDLRMFKNIKNKGYKDWKVALDELKDERFFKNTHSPKKTILSTRKINEKD